MDHFEKRLSGTTVFKGHIVEVQVDQVELEDGRSAEREIVRHHGGACVAALTDSGEVFLVRQFRYAFGENLWELPAGKLEENEDPFEAAKRELREECGVTADRWTDLLPIYPTVGYDDEIIYMYFAAGLHPAEMHLDDGEFLTPEKVPLEKALEMVRTGEIRDGKTAAALLKVKAWGLDRQA